MAYVSPWKSCFRGAKITKQVNVRVDEEPSCERVRMSSLDSSLAVVPLFPIFILVFKQAIDFDRLHAAAKTLLRRYPVYSGRVRTDKEFLEIELSNEGFPLSAVEWPEGSLDDFPAALDVKDWEGELPANINPPILVHGLNAVDTLLNNAPVFTLRLTTLGREGCVLSCTMHHMLADGTRQMESMVDLSRAYRGESLQPLGSWLHREALLAENIHELLPGGKEVVEQAREAVTDDPPLPEGITFKDMLEATIAKPGRNPDTWVWVSPPEMPKGPRRLSLVMLHLPKLELEQLKSDVVAHASAKGNDLPAYISIHDIMVGFFWCLRSIFADVPLPGQDGAARTEVGFVALDIGYNAFKKRVLEGFFGNGIGPAPLVLPPSTTGGASANGIAANGNGTEATHAPDYSRDALLKGIGVIAALMRANVNDWRNPDGQNLKDFLQNLCSPQRVYKEYAMLEAVAFSGTMTHRSFVTSWERFPVKEVVFDESAGPPLHLLPLWTILTDPHCTLVPSMEDGSPLAHLTIQAEREFDNTLDIVRTLLPGASLL